MFFAFLEKFRDIARRLHMKRLTDDVSHFYLKVARETVAYREKNDIDRNDFMGILIKMKNQITNGTTEEPLTLNELAAQTFLFFVAGFETSSATLSFGLYELALNPEVQKKARESVLQTLKKYNGECTYEMLLDVPYIDQIIYGKWI